MEYILTFVKVGPALSGREEKIIRKIIKNEENGYIIEHDYMVWLQGENDAV